jgi:hypothetical protein
MKECFTQGYRKTELHSGENIAQASQEVKLFGAETECLQ